MSILNLLEDGIDIDVTKLPKNYLSASQIDMYLKCPKQYEFRYVYGKILPPQIAMVEGAALHKALEYYYSKKIENKIEQPQHVAEYAVNQLEEIAKEVGLKIEDDSVKYTIEEATEKYVVDVGEHTIPLAVEKEITFTLESGVNILGYIDLLKKYDLEDADNFESSEPSESSESSESNTSTVVVDYKYSSKKWTKDRLNESIQFGIYSSINYEPVEVHNIVKTKNIGIYKIYDDFKNYNYSHLFNIINGVAEGISKGYFPPCRMDSWWCSEKWCGYYSICRGKR